MKVGRSVRRCWAIGLCAMMVWLAAGTASAAQTPGPAAAPAATPTVDKGDNAWMLTSSALVLMMTGPGLGPFLLRPGAEEERAERHDAVRLPDVPDERDLGHLRLLARLRRHGERLDRRRHSYLFMHKAEATWVPGTTANRVTSTSPCATRASAHPRAHPHALPGDVLCHYAGVDLRGVRRADEVQHDGGVHDPLGHVDLLSAVPTGSGAAAC